MLQRQPALTWSPSQLAQRLYLSEPRAAELLQALEAADIAAKCNAGAETMYRYSPSSELAVMLKRLSGHYSSDLLAVTDLIHSRLDRQAYQFADAFRWRKDS